MSSCVGMVGPPRRVAYARIVRASQPGRKGRAARKKRGLTEPRFSGPLRGMDVCDTLRSGGFYPASAPAREMRTVSRGSLLAPHWRRGRHLAMRMNPMRFSHSVLQDGGGVRREHYTCSAASARESSHGRAVLAYRIAPP